MIEIKPSRQSSMHHAIRFMTGRDLEEIAEIEVAAQLSVWGIDGYEAELTNEYAIVRVVDASQLQSQDLSKLSASMTPYRIAAFAAARIVVDELHITNIAVRNEARRGGLGGLLVRDLMQCARRRGLRWAVLEVRESNGDANRLYARHGFEITGRRPDYYRNPAEDALIMARLI